MDSKRAFDIQRAAEIRADVYNRKRRQYAEAERTRKSLENFFQGKGRGKSSGGGLSVFGVLFLGVLIGAGIFNSGSKNAPTTSAPVAQPTAPDATPVVPAAPAMQPRPYVADATALATTHTPAAPPRLGVVYSNIPPNLGATPSQPDTPQAPPAPIPAPEAQPAPTIDVGAQLVANSSLKYPAQAIRHRHEGTVHLLISVGPDGTVQNVAVQTSSGYQELDRSAVESAYRWHFRPAYSHGQAVASQVTAPVDFNLNQF